MEMEADLMNEDDLEREELIRSCLQLASELEQLDGELREKREKNKQLEEELAEAGERPERDGHQQEVVGISDCRVDDFLFEDDLEQEEEVRRYLRLERELKKLKDKFGEPATKSLQLEQSEDNVFEVSSGQEERPEVGQQNDGQENQAQDNDFQGDELSLEDAQENESEDALQRNELENQSQDNDYWQCQHPGCGRRFKNKECLRKHRYIHTTKYQCQECQKCFEGSSQLKTHFPVHTRERPFVCDWEGCGQRFKQKSNLKNHTKLIHSDDFPFRCHYENCLKIFKRKNCLHRHLQTHSSSRPFKCRFPGCSKSFKLKLCTNLHMKQVHSDVRPFHCHYEGCAKAFKTKKHLQNHLNTHLETRTLHCRFPGCPKTFKLKTCLNEHMKYVHSDSKQFRCDVTNCQKTFKSKQGLYNHKKTCNNLNSK